MCLTYFLPSARCKQTPSSFCHPFPLSECGGDLFSPLSLSLCLSPLAAFSFPPFSLSLSRTSCCSVPCGPLPLLSAPLSSCPASLSPLALLLSPSPHLLEQLLHRPYCCPYFFMSLMRVPTPLCLRLSATPSPSLSLLGIKLRGLSWGLIFCTAPQDSRVQVSRRRKKGRICRDFHTTPYLHSSSGGRRTVSAVFSSQLDINRFIFYPSGCADGQGHVCVSVVRRGRGWAESGAGPGPQQRRVSAASRLGPHGVGAPCHPEAASRGGEVHALHALHHPHPEGSRAQGGARQVGPGGRKLLILPHDPGWVVSSQQLSHRCPLSFLCRCAVRSAVMRQCFLCLSLWWTASCLPLCLCPCHRTAWPPAASSSHPNSQSATTSPQTLCVPQPSTASRLRPCGWVHHLVVVEAGVVKMATLVHFQLWAPNTITYIKLQCKL